MADVMTFSDLPEVDEYRNGYGRSRWEFERATAHHRMRVLKDDGFYRHLRFRDPGNWAYSYDLVTWPGFLVVGGDTQHFMFSRTQDMFRFFEGDRDSINPDYWAQKLIAPEPRAARKFEHESFRRRVLEWFNDQREELDAEEAMSLRAAVEDELLNPWNDHTDNETLSVKALMDFEHDGITVDEPYEWDLRTWDTHYLWACWAIVHGIAAYRVGEFR